MSEHRIVVTKSDFKLRVLAGAGKVVRAYDIAIGERADGKARIYEEDFRTPEGSFRVERKHLMAMYGDLSSSRPSGPNVHYYPFYLAHKFGSPFEDLGYSAYGQGLIGLSYPRQEDLRNYQRLLESGEIKRDWSDFMEEKWRAVFEHVSETTGVAFGEVRLSHEKRKGEKRNFLEGKTFDELCNSTPPLPELPMAIILGVKKKRR